MTAFQQLGQGAAVRVSYDVSNDLSTSFGRKIPKNQMEDPRSHSHGHHNNHNHSSHQSLPRGVVRDAWMDNQDDKIDPREYMTGSGGGGQGQRSRGISSSPFIPSSLITPSLITPSLLIRQPLLHY